MGYNLIKLFNFRINVFGLLNINKYIQAILNIKILITSYNLEHYIGLIGFI